MKKVSLLMLLLLSIFFIGANTTKATTKDDDGVRYIIIPDKATAVADGQDKITFQLGDFVTTDLSINYSTPNPCMSGASMDNPKPRCGMYDSSTTCKYSSAFVLAIKVTGSGNSFEGIKGCKDGWCQLDSVINCQNGYASFNMRSTVEEEKTITFGLSGDALVSSGPIEYFDAVSTKVTFLAKKSTTKPTSTSTPTTSAPSKPTLSLSTTSRIGTNDISSTLDTTQPISIIPAQKLTFSGTASANAKVTLTIKSDPITREVTADAAGSWTYTLDPIELALETGNHTVTAVATDSAGVKSDEVALGTFELKSPPIATPAPKPYKFQAKDLLIPINYVLGGLIILLVGSLIFLFIRRRKAKLNIEANMDMEGR